MNIAAIKAQYQTLPIVPTDCTGQTIIVTGANAGLGYEAAKHFVQLGATRVILAVRSTSKGATAQESIEAETGRKGVAEVWPLDLASNDSIRAFAKRANDELDRIDVVLENAGVAFDEWTEAEGTETTVQVNVLGTFLLALLLMPALKRSARKWSITPHLTVVTSGLHTVAKFVERQEDDIFAALSRKDDVNIADRFVSRPTKPTFMSLTHHRPSYNVSKLLEVYAVRELATLLPVSDSGVVVNMVNPGLCYSDLGRNVGLLYRMQIGLLRLLMARSTEVGSRTLIHAAVAGVDSHGKYCSECEIKE